MSFDLAVKRVIKSEGGYVNDPKDPGGETKYGISKRAYPDVDIAAMSLEYAERLYRRDYWVKLPTLPEPLDYLVFDFAVNAGVGRAIKVLQITLKVTPDGHFGAKSKAALSKYSTEDLCINFSAERACYYASLNDDLVDRFGRGWMRRVMESFHYAIQFLKSTKG